MTLTAIVPDHGVVIADDMCEGDRAENHFFCKYCGGELRLVLPSHKIKHFRHLPGASCMYSGESYQHLEAKMFFYNKFLNDDNYKSVELEKVIHLNDVDGNSFMRIGDVVIYPKDESIRPTVIEVQHSNITNNEIMARFHDWNDIRRSRVKYEYYKSNRNGKKVMRQRNVYDSYNMLWVYVPGGNNGIPKWSMSLRSIYGGKLYIFFNGLLYDARFYRSDYGYGYSRNIEGSKTFEVIDFDILQKHVKLKNYYTNNIEKCFCISYFNDFRTHE